MRVMYKDEEEKVELPAIEQLKQLGWEYMHGASLAPQSVVAAKSALGVSEVSAAYIVGN